MIGGQGDDARQDFPGPCESDQRPIAWRYGGKIHRVARIELFT